MNWFKAVVATLALAGASAVLAAQTPHELIDATSQALVSRLDAQKDAMKQDPNIVVGIVNDVVLPTMDVPTISRKVLGKHWKGASPEQQAKFTEQFRSYMVRFYSRVFANYNGEKLEILPEIASKEPDFAVVKTQIVKSSGQTIPVDYRLQKQADGSWKVIDFKAEGVSLVINNQKQYGAQVGKDGLDAVIATLTSKNNQPLTR
ncbi:MAG: ABC transporter substrate-binding protein [Gammaproteobacteria bacterium]|nr:ABC transporter substrate-binding protein [Gammaproteobacteria bacterium]